MTLIRIISFKDYTIHSSDFIGKQNQEVFHISKKNGMFYSFKTKKFDQELWSDECMESLNECLKVIGYKLYG